MTDEPKIDMPDGWQVARLCMVTEVNPRLDKFAGNDNPTVSFVPMPAVGAGTGTIDVSRTRSLQDVKKGYRHFREGDVLFAKITPCMENGKMAIVPSLKYDLGFGSTEFHVLRPNRKISAQYIYWFVSSEQFRRDAQHNMTGAVGQRRVPAPYLAHQTIPVPPAREQSRIVAKIEELFSELDKGVESLKTARAQLNVYRQTVLKHAFEGKLTAKWREENKDKLETPEQLLARIKQEREARYQQLLKEWETAVEEWEANGKPGKKPIKPKHRLNIEAKHIPQEARPASAAAWASSRLGELNVLVSDGPFGTNLRTRDYIGAGIRVIRLENVGHGKFLEERRSFISQEKYETIKKHSVIPGTIVVSSFVTEGVRSCIVPDTIPISVNKADCFTVILAGQRTSRRFLAYFLQSRQAFEQLEPLVHGVGRPRINTTQLKEMHIPVCSPAEQTEIVRILDESLVAAEMLGVEIDANLVRAETLRQSILKKAFAGELIPQDPNDESASALLTRIRAERAEAPARRRTKRVFVEA